MGTKAAIIVKTAKGFELGFCLYDGYVDGAGKNLSGYNAKQAASLVRLGVVRSVPAADNIAAAEVVQDAASVFPSLDEALEAAYCRYEPDFTYVRAGRSWSFCRRAGQLAPLRAA